MHLPRKQVIIIKSITHKFIACKNGKNKTYPTYTRCKWSQCHCYDINLIHLIYLIHTWSTWYTFDTSWLPLDLDTHLMHHDTLWYTRNRLIHLTKTLIHLILLITHDSSWYIWYPFGFDTLKGFTNKFDTLGALLINLLYFIGTFNKIWSVWCTLYVWYTKCTSCTLSILQQCTWLVKYTCLIKYT